MAITKLTALIGYRFSLQERWSVVEVDANLLISRRPRIDREALPAINAPVVRLRKNQFFE